jgi:hypothetical protein
MSFDRDFLSGVAGNGSSDRRGSNAEFGKRNGFGGGE